MWLHDALRSADRITGATNLVSPSPVVGVQWQNAHLGTCGKIGISWENWVRLGGYDETMLAMGCQDVDLVRRMNLVGVVEHKNKKDGFTVSNQPEEFDRLLASDGKAKRKEAFDENKAKLQHLPDFEKNVLGSFAKICEHNGKIMKARLKKGIWKVNTGVETGVPTYRCAYNPRITVEGEARLWGDGVVVQPGIDRQEVRLVPALSDTTDIPTPNVVLRN